MANMACALAAVMLVAVGATPPPIASAQETSEAVLSGTTGDELFKTYCASCHGKSAKGDGLLASHLRFRPPDLTLIAKRNGGKFDSDKVHRIIDGREEVKGHGGTDMPVWGDAFKRSVGSETSVKARIAGIVDYLKSIQVK